MSDSLPRAVRPASGRVVGGVCQGIANHFDINVMMVRIAFVVLCILKPVLGLGYLALWGFLPVEQDPQTPTDQVGAARHSGAHHRREWLQSVGLLAVAVGASLLLFVTGVLSHPRQVVPVMAGLVGVVIIWRLLDETRWSTWMRQERGWRFGLRLAAGFVLVAVSVLVGVSQSVGFSALLDLAVVLFIAVVGVILLVGPWVARLVGDLSSERRERIRSQERADVAAHLHDSVLQTLALLQKNSSDPATVATLARRQERELRQWLYGREVQLEGSVVQALEKTAAEVEQDHQVPIDVVTVGDRALDPHSWALVKAAREAMVNAAKHSGADRVDVYVESAPERIEVFVRDRGAGFDVDMVAEDRRGVRESIVARMERHGGTATIRSDSERGTEVHLLLETEAEEGQDS